MRCSVCGADNPESNRFCGRCGRKLTQVTDERYGSPDPIYPEAAEEPYVVWKWPYAIWATISQTRSQFMLRTALYWMLVAFVMLVLILQAGYLGLIAALAFAIVSAIALYLVWKAGREAANELNQMRRRGIEPPMDRR